MSGATHLKKPMSCTTGEIQEFASLVREGFRGSDEGLLGRVETARLLAFHYAVDDSLAAIAGLKEPSGRHRRDLFNKASVYVSPADYEVELGWVYVVPNERGARLAEDICRQLLAGESGAGVYATTRSNNAPMIEILRNLGFALTGEPFSRRDEELVMLLRS